MAAWPTCTGSPVEGDKATAEGIVRFPLSSGISFGELPSMKATQENVVPKSMPTTGRLAAIDEALRKP